MPQRYSLWTKLLFALFLFGLSTHSLQAQQLFELAEIDQDRVEFKAYNSYQKKLLLLEFSNKNQASFDCQPNRFVFFDYANNRLFEIQGGNLMINRDYTGFVYTKIHVLGGMNPSNKDRWKKEVAQILTHLKVSAQTMESGKSKSKKRNVACWIQPAYMDIKGENAIFFPYMAANLCRNGFCSEFYWTDSGRIQFWAQIEPEKLHLINLEIQSGDFRYVKHGKVFYKKNIDQASAPRDNLINEKNRKTGKVNLDSSKGGLKLIWDGTTKGTTKVLLFRNRSDSLAATKMKFQIERLLEEKKVTEAKKMVDFALWLDPGNEMILFENLKILNALKQYDLLFESLETDFGKGKKTGACQKIHLDKSFRTFWTLPQNVQRFKKTCS